MKFEGEAAIQLARAFGGGFSKNRNYRKTDIDCSQCTSKVVFTEPGIIHQDPPRKRIRCLNCGHTGWHNVPDPGPSIDITDQLTIESSCRNEQED